MLTRPFGTAPRSREAVVLELKALCRTNSKGCWLLPGAPANSSGHRRVQYQGVQQGAHVFVYETEIGPVPEGHDLNHTCEEPPCINPEHLEPLHERSTCVGTGWYDGLQVRAPAKRGEHQGEQQRAARMPAVLPATGPQLQGERSMLKLAVEAQLPLVAAHTRDTLNLHRVVIEITKEADPLVAAGQGGSRRALLLGLRQEVEVNWMPVYNMMVGKESTLLVVNPPKIDEPMFDAGEIPVPRSLMM